MASILDISQHFPPFDLARLLQTIFYPKKNEKLCILIDLDDPAEVINFSFTQNKALTVQQKAFEVFFQGLHRGAIEQLGLECCELFAYQTTGGSNLELPSTVIAPDGFIYDMNRDIYSFYDIILCISTYSATAPLTAAAKKYGFRGATLHGLNDIILQTGLAVDYNEISRETEKLRHGMTRADHIDIDFEVESLKFQLRVELKGQEAQKSHGLCRAASDIVNLPAGEVYFVPTGASGHFPMKFEDGTLACCHVEQGRVIDATLIRGRSDTVAHFKTKLQEDSAVGILGEIGFGTQILPWSGADIQDEKIFGTFHLATGRNDHLDGSVTKDCFKNSRNATHEDILFSAVKTPEIKVKQVRMARHGQTVALIEDYEPSTYLWNLRTASEFANF